MAIASTKGAVRSTAIRQRRRLYMSNNYENYENKEELRSLLPTYLEMLEDMGMTENRGNDYWDCPFCGSGTGINQTAAFHLLEDGTKYKCFACGESGDIFDLVRHIENMESERYPKVYAKTEKIMKSYLGKQVQSEKGSDKENKQDIKQQDYSEYLKDCHLQVFLTNYFYKRGLSDRIIDKFQLGFDQKQNIVTIPYNAGHEGTGYIHRVLWTSGNKYIKHGNELFNIDAIRNNDSNCVFITEGQIDAMSFEEIGYPALGLGSVNETDKLIKLLNKTGTYKRWIIALDNDVPGRRATGKLIEAIANTEMPFNVMSVSWIYENYKDPNEFLVKDRNGFEKQIKKIVSVI